MVAVRSDLAAVRAELRTEIAAVRADLKTEIAAVRGDIAALRTELKNDIALAVRDMTIRMGMIAVALFAALASIKFFR